MDSRLPSSSNLLTSLLNLDQIKVWSLLVTLFGDLTVDNDTALSGSLLNRLFADMGIKPEALRVALHRLKKDHWIATEKQGRTSNYRLTQHGLHETKSVFPKVYGLIRPTTDKWNLVILRDEKADLPHGHIPIAPRCILIRQAIFTPHADAFVVPLPNHDIPPWILGNLAPDPLLNNADNLIRLLSNFSPPSNISPLNALVLRTLILHHWRRMALRESTWTHMSIQQDSPFANCHIAVHAALEKLPKPNPNVL